MFRNHYPMPGISNFSAQDSDPGITCEGRSSYRRNGLQIKRKKIGKLLSSVDINSRTDYNRFQIIHINYAQQIKIMISFMTTIKEFNQGTLK